MQNIIVDFSPGEIRRMARETLRGNWWRAMWGVLLAMLLVQVPIIILDSIIAAYTPGTPAVPVTGPGIIPTDYASIMDAVGAVYMSITDTIGMIYAAMPGSLGDVPTGLGVSLAMTASPTYYLFNLLIGGPISLGVVMFTLGYVRERVCRTELIIAGFANFVRSLGIYAIYCIVVGAGILCLLVPGIIFALALMPIFFILADNPGMGILSVIRSSLTMMKGNKASLFWLVLSFMGWYIGAALFMMVAATLGVLLSGIAGIGANTIFMTLELLFTVVLVPLLTYVRTAMAIFYEMLAGHRPAYRYNPYYGGMPGGYPGPQGQFPPYGPYQNYGPYGQPGQLPPYGQPPDGQLGQYGQPPDGQLGQYGQPPDGQLGQYGQPPYGQPQSGQPGQAEGGSEQYGQPPYDQTGQPGQYVQPPDGQLGQYGQPPYDQTGQPGQYVQPPDGQSGQYGQPPDGQPGQYGQPPDGQLGQYGQPPDSQPEQYGQPPYDQTGQPGQYDQPPSGQPEQTDKPDQSGQD